MWKNGIPIVFLVLVIGWGIYDYSQNKKEQSLPPTQTEQIENVEVGINKGNQAPNFALLDLDGNEVELSDFVGKKVILNFWATWCPPCRAEMPHMESVYKKNSEEVVILGVNLTNTEKNESDVHTFVDDFKLSFPIVLDTQGKIASQYQIFAYPTSLMIDTNGIIREIYRGPITEDIMKKSLAKMN